MSDHGKQVLWLFLIAATVLAAGIGLRDPWPPDEPRFALIAREMVQTGDWLIPHVGGVVYPEKPPLFFWFVAIVYTVTHSLRFAFLAPAFLSGLIVLWLVYDLARRFWGRDKALWTGATLLAILQFPLQMKAGQIDGFLCLWTTLGLYGFCRHLLLGPAWRWYTAAGFACGLGVVTKGVGFLPFLIFIPYLVAVRRNWPLPAITGSGGKWFLAPMAFTVAIGLWLVPMLLATSGSADAELLQYRDNILLKQTVTRYADAWGHLKPPWYLVTNAVPWLWLPVSLLLPWLIPAWLTELRLKSTVTLALGGWIVLVLLFFSISDGKRSVYILPAVPALALVAGHHLPAILSRSVPRCLLFTLALLLASLPFVTGAYALANPHILRDWLPDPATAVQLSWIAIGIGSVAIIVVTWFRMGNVAFAFAGGMMVIWIGVSLLVYPNINAVRSGTVIIDAAASAVSADQNLGFAGWKEQFLLQWHRPAVHFGYRRPDIENESREAAAWLSGDPRNRLALPGGMIEPCFARSELSELGLAHRQRWFLAAGSSVRASCMERPAAGNNVVFYPAASTAAHPMPMELKSAR